VSDERTVMIGFDHPSIAGHFPGRPVVPGVVILGEVLETIRLAEPDLKTVIGIPVAKFASPLKPGECFVIQVTRTAPEQVSFICRAGGRWVASGVIDFAIAPESVNPA
jgi:3-hydroxyacyl-[acyl-carrier-protein] dehydratase